jgi:hypothetical protein
LGEGAKERWEQEPQRGRKEQQEEYNPFYILVSNILCLKLKYFFKTKQQLNFIY